MPPDQPQTLPRCAALRESCQREIFNKMDTQHNEVMGAIVDLEKKVAYDAGRGDALKPNSKPHTRTHKDGHSLLFQIIVAWSLPIAFLLILGIIAYLRMQGYLK